MLNTNICLILKLNLTYNTYTSSRMTEIDGSVTYIK